MDQSFPESLALRLGIGLGFGIGVVISIWIVSDLESDSKFQVVVDSVAEYTINHEILLGIRETRSRNTSLSVPGSESILEKVLVTESDSNSVSEIHLLRSQTRNWDLKVRETVSRT